MKSIVLFISVVYLLLSVNAHECIHDKIFEQYHPNNTFVIIPQDSDDHGFHSQSMGPIRIALSTEDLYKSSEYCVRVGQRIKVNRETMICKEEDILTTAKREKLLKSIIPEAVNYLQKALRVNRVSSPLKVRDDTCWNQVTVSRDHQQNGVEDADFVLYVTGRPTSGGTVAWALSCAYDRRGRPIIGHANFGPAKLTGSSDQSMVKTAIHEFMHALGFSKQWAEKYFLYPNNNPTSKVSVRGKTAHAITSSEVVRTARDYYGCQSLNFLELEDNGGSGTAGSHWDKRVLFNEMMVGFGTPGEVTQAVSPMTLAFFKDSGHYNVDYTMVDNDFQNYFGRNAGCEFISKACSSSVGQKFFCFEKDKYQCAGDRMSIGKCNIATYSSSLPEMFQYFRSSRQGGSDEHTDYCPYVQAYSNTVCATDAHRPDQSDLTRGNSYGLNGRCFETRDADGGLETGGFRKDTRSYYPGEGFRCFKTRCVDGQVEVQPGELYKWLSCPRGGGELKAPDGYLGIIICPSEEEICSPEITEGGSTSASSPTTRPTSTSGPSYRPTPKPTPRPTSTPRPTPKPTRFYYTPRPTSRPTRRPRRSYSFWDWYYSSN